MWGGGLHAHLYHRFPILLVTPDGFNLTCKLIGKCYSRCSMAVVNIVKQVGHNSLVGELFR